MGTLEDTIKEHLELKRKAGAEDEEISKMEKEAFGPAEPAPVVAPPPVASPTHPAVAAAGPAAPVEVEPTPEPLAEAEPEPVHTEPEAEISPATEAEPEPAPEPEIEPEPEVVEPEDAVEPEVATLDQPTEPHQAVDMVDEEVVEEPAEQLVETPLGEEPERPEPGFEDAFNTDEHDLPEEPTQDDLLEETPEFLEGTPEDEKLWFEQKAPKDFDFND